MAINSTLAAIRARLVESENKKTKNFNNNVNYDFWDMKAGATAVARFLPDADATNEYFWVEKQQLKFPFNGIVGGDNKPVYVYVPCVDMWKSDFPQGCPVRSQISPWYEEAKKTNDDALKAKANTYWKKYSYIMQALIRKNPIAEDLENAPENPIRLLSVNKQLMNIIKTGIMDPEMLNIPCDYEHGTDFRILKTTKGEYFDYGTSNYARSESALTVDELDAIEKYGLFNLADFQGKKPNAAELNAIVEMFEASVNGEAYDPARWKQYYRPAGMKATENTESSAPVTATASAPKVTAPAVAKVQTEVVDAEESAPVATTTLPATKASTADILAMIKNRGKASA